MRDVDALLEELLRRMPAHDTAQPGEIASAEIALGFRLPSLLRRMYAEVADGGFGPGYGLFPLQHGRPGHEETLVGTRNMMAADPRWPSLLLPLCDWGCAIWSCLDCHADDGPIVTQAGEEPFMDTGHNLHSWLDAWLSGTDLWIEMFEPGPKIVGRNPFTKQPMEWSGQGKPRGRRWP